MNSMKRQKDMTVEDEPPQVRRCVVWGGRKCHEMMGPDMMILGFWILSFKPAFSLSFLSFIKRFFSFASLSPFRVVSSAYLRLLIFLLANLIPAYASSSLGFHVMHSAYKLNKQSTSWERLGWKKHKLESRLPGEISTTSDRQMIPPCGRKQRRTRESLDESEREWKNWLETQHSKTKIMASSPITSWQIDAMILVFWMLSFKPAFSLSSFTFIKRLFSSSLLSL